MLKDPRAPAPFGDVSARLVALVPGARGRFAAKSSSPAASHYRFPGPPSIVDDELHTWFNDQTRSLDAELSGRASTS